MSGALIAALSRGVREGPAARLLPYRVVAALERWTLDHGYPAATALQLGEATASGAAATLLFGGDLALSRVPPGSEGERLMDGVVPLMRSADAAILNLETQLTARTTPAGTIGSVLRADPASLGVLRRLGIRAVTCANNHCLDHGALALAESVERVESAGIAVAGIHDGTRSGDVVFSAGGLRVGMLAYADDWRVEGEADGPARPVAHEPGAVRAAIAAMAGRCDLVVVQLHWGYEWSMYPMRSQRDLARSYIEAGAHLVLCHHAHVPMGVERWRQGIVAHGLGNFYFGPSRGQSHPFRNASFVLRVSAKAGAVLGAEVIPVGTGPAGEAVADSGFRAARTLACVAHLSDRLGADRYLDRVEASLELIQGSVLLRSLAQLLRDGKDEAVRERVRYMRPPRQHLLTASLQRRGGVPASIGSLLAELREDLDPFQPPARTRIAALAERVEHFMARDRAVGRIP